MAGTTGSLKQTNKLLAPITEIEVITGSDVSGIVEKTEFCSPGVPPQASLLAIQLEFVEHVSFGLINSSDHPPSSLIAS